MKRWESEIIKINFHKNWTWSFSPIRKKKKKWKKEKMKKRKKITKDNLNPALAWNHYLTATKIRKKNKSKRSRRKGFVWSEVWEKCGVRWLEVFFLLITFFMSWFRGKTEKTWNKRVFFQFIFYKWLLVWFKLWL